MGGEFLKFNLFSSFRTVTEEETGRMALHVAVSGNLAYILNTDPEYMPHGVKGLLSGGYTKYELRQHNSLISTYSKNAFRHLKRFERTGWWKVSLGEFKRLLDVPESYRLSDLRRRVLTPIRDELSNYFEGLKIEEVKGVGPKGRMTTTHLYFTFKRNTEKGVWFDDDTRGMLSDEYRCPACGEPLYAIIKEDGDVFYGHKEGWKATAPCTRTFGSLDEIVGLNGDVETSSDYKARDEGHRPEKTGFRCRECGRPLYMRYNEKGESFYGHIDGWKKDALCRTTYGSVAEIKGLSETPVREDFYILRERGEAEQDDEDGYFGVYDVLKNIKIGE